MPHLGLLDCHVIYTHNNQELHEYGTQYYDAAVETFVTIPPHPCKFSIHLKAFTFISSCIAAFVFIDGQYQTNRNHRGFKETSNAKYEVVFRGRENSNDDHTVSRSAWWFDGIKFITDTTQSIPSKLLEDLGTIEVVVLRCREPIPKFESIPRHYSTSTARSRSFRQPRCSDDDYDNEYMTSAIQFDGPSDRRNRNRSNVPAVFPVPVQVQAPMMYPQYGYPGHQLHPAHHGYSGFTQWAPALNLTNALGNSLGQPPGHTDSQNVSAEHRGRSKSRKASKSHSDNVSNSESSSSSDGTDVSKHKSKRSRSRTRTKYKLQHKSRKGSKKRNKRNKSKRKKNQDKNSSKSESTVNNEYKWDDDPGDNDFLVARDNSWAHSQNDTANTAGNANYNNNSNTDQWTAVAESNKANESAAKATDSMSAATALSSKARIDGCNALFNPKWKNVIVSSAAVLGRGEGRGEEKSRPKIALANVPQGIKHQVVVESEEKIKHMTGIPEYLDTFENPYAVFKFKYRDRDTLKTLLNIDIPVEQTNDISYYASLSREELIKLLMNTKISE